LADRDELIAAGVGNIRIWTFNMVVKNATIIYQFDSPKIVIEDFNTEDWVSLTLVNSSGLLYAAFSNNINVSHS
jgi:hypothetical protein